MRSQDYKTPSCESGKGNISGDIMRYTFTGAESADTVISLRRMSEYNSYVRITYSADQLHADTEIDLGYVSLDPGEANDLTAFIDGLDPSAVDYAQVLVAMPVKVAFDHEIAMTIKVNNAANAGNEIRFLVEFINVAG